MGRKQVAGSAKIAVAYIRASKDEQRLSDPAQRAAIEAWAAREGVQVAAWHVDQGVCSVTPIEERPALVAALAALREHGAGVLVVAKRDRIARDVVLTAMIERIVAKTGARVVSAAGEGNGATPADEFMRTVIDGAAQYERSLIRARTSAALQAKRARGERVSARIPFGFTVAEDGVRLVPVEREQVAIAKARALREVGLSYDKVSAALATEGLVSRSGRPFQAVQVRRMIGTAS